MEVRRCQNLMESDAVICLFEKIAAEESWQPGDQLRAHVARSVYFGVWDQARLVGGLQLIVPDDAGEVPTHQVWPELPTLDVTSSVLHAAVLAVLPEYRGKDGGAAFWQLGSALWRYCVENQLKTIWLEATPKMLRCYRLLGWPLIVNGELRMHWGEPCFACSLSVREIAGSLAERALSSRTYREIISYMLQPEAGISGQ